MLMVLFKHPLPPSNNNNNNNNNNNSNSNKINFQDIFLKKGMYYVQSAGKHHLLDPRGGGGGTPLYGLYRYVPRNRVGFLEVLDP